MDTTKEIMQGQVREVGLGKDGVALFQATAVGLGLHWYGPPGTPVKAWGEKWYHEGQPVRRIRLVHAESGKILASHRELSP